MTSAGTERMHECKEHAKVEGSWPPATPSSSWQSGKSTDPRKGVTDSQNSSHNLGGMYESERKTCKWKAVAVALDCRRRSV